jgi:hypothetical protein
MEIDTLFIMQASQFRPHPKRARINHRRALY